MVPFKTTAQEVPFEWSHHRILLTDSKVRTTLHVSTIDSGSERVQLLSFSCSHFNLELNDHWYQSSSKWSVVNQKPK